MYVCFVGISVRCIIVAIFLDFHAMTILGKLVDCCFVGISVRWIIVAIVFRLPCYDNVGKAGRLLFCGD